jgi:pyruvate kinase
MALYRGVVSIPFDATGMQPTEVNQEALKLLHRHGLANPGEHVILTNEDYMNAHGSTNTAKVLALDSE